MRIYFATNRDPDNIDAPTGFGERFSANGLTDLRFGVAEVSGKKFDHYTLEVADEKLDVGLANAAVGNLAKQKLGSQEIFERVRLEMLEQKQDCLILVHGFNTSFAGALQLAAQVKDFYAARPMTVFLFTWPSDGSLLPFKAYASDRDDARASGVALGRGLQKLAAYLRGTRPEDYCGQSVHLFAHSMGNYALRWALQGIRSCNGGQLRRLLDQIALFAPDEDDDAFELEHKFLTLPDMARRVTVYHNAADKALIVSDSTKSNPDRLGASGPRNSRALPDKVSVVNCEPALNFLNDPSGHHYFYQNEAVRRDVLAVLDGTPPQDISRREYLADTRSYRLMRKAR